MDTNRQKGLQHIAVRSLIVFAFLLGATALVAYQVRRAERGRSSLLPLPLRRFIAERVYHDAENAGYESEQLSGYLKVVSLDPTDFPGAWRHLCDHYTKYGQTEAAEVSCARAADLERQPRREK